MIEGDPATGIVDIETFKWWLVSYKEDIFANPPDRVMAGSGQAGYQLLRKLFPDSPSSSSISLNGCQWEKVPPGLQEVVAQLYESARLEGEKRVDVGFMLDSISFRLKSDHVGLFIDFYGENYVGTGLELSLTSGQPGEWKLTKAPKVLADRWMRSGMEGEQEDELLDQMRQYIRTIPVSLPQLHDVARFLVTNRDRAVVSVFYNEQ